LLESRKIYAVKGLQTNSPSRENPQPVVSIKPGTPFDFGKLDLSVQAALKDVPKVGFEKIMAHFTVGSLILTAQRD
jgi:rubredoxin